MQNKILTTFVIISLLGIGVLVGIVIGNFPYITFKSEVSFGEVANFIVAVILAVLIPISITKWLDSNKFIKAFLIEEIRNINNYLERLKEEIDKCVIAGSTSPTDIKRIMAMLNFLSIQIASLREQLELSFNKQTFEIRTSLFNEYIKYWEDLTSGNLLTANYQINNSFSKSHDKSMLSFENYLKCLVHKIYKF